MTRTRSRGIGRYTGTCETFYTINGVESSRDKYPQTFIDEETMVDVVTPHFKRLSASGATVNNPLFVTKVQDSCGSGNSTVLTSPSFPGHARTYLSGPWTMYWWGGNLTCGLWQSEIDAFNASISNAIALAKQTALSNIDRTPYAFLEDWAEFHKTAKSLGHPLETAKNASERFRRKVNDRRGFYLKRGRISLFEATSKAFADAWLSSRYEWRPILISLSNILSGLPKVHTRPKRLKAYASEKGSFVRTQTAYSSHSGAVENDVSLDLRFEVKAWITYTMLQQHDYKDFDLGVRLKDMPKTAWALVPLSFVYDRFFDITKTIEGLSNLLDPRLVIYAGGVNIKREDINLLSSTWNGVSGNWTGAPLFGGVHRKYVKTFQREPWAPSSLDTLPTFTGDRALSDFSNLLDIASIVTKNLRLTSYLSPTRG